LTKKVLAEQGYGVITREAVPDQAKRDAMKEARRRLSAMKEKGQSFESILNETKRILEEDSMLAA
jgi:hypothetical protein